VLLPVIDREPLFHLEEQDDRRGLPAGRGGMASRDPRSPAGSIGASRGGPRGLHLLEAIVRSPWALATLLEAAPAGDGRVAEEPGR